MHRNWTLLAIFAATFLAAFSGYFIFKGTQSSSTPPESIKSSATEPTGIAVFPTWDLLSPAEFPLIIDGEAPGPWFFEASFPLEVQLPDGTVVARGFSTAQGEWMTEGAVPFYAEVKPLKDAQSYQGAATLILRKANASGLPEHDGEFTLPINIHISS